MKRIAAAVLSCVMIFCASIPAFAELTSVERVPVNLAQPDGDIVPSASTYGTVTGYQSNAWGWLAGLIDGKYSESTAAGDNELKSTTWVIQGATADPTEEEPWGFSVDLKREVEMNRARLYIAPSYSQNVVNFRIEVGHDDTWQEVYKYDGASTPFTSAYQKGYYVDFKFDTVIGDKIRFLVTARGDKGNRHAGFQEFCVFNDTIRADNVTVDGSGNVDEELVGKYTYSYDSDYASEEGESLYRWLVSDRENGEYTAISGATSDTYVPKTADNRKYIKFEVTPVENNGRKGLPTVSAPVQIYNTNLSADETAVENTKAELELGVKTAVGDFALPDTVGDYGAKITWSVKTASRAVKISSDGKTAQVTRPSADEEDVEVTLTALIKKGEYSAEKEFTVTVPKSSPDSTMLEEAVNEVNIPTSAASGAAISLPDKTSNGASIVWSCGVAGIISGGSAIMRAQRNGYITLIGDYSYNGQKKSASYVVRVPFDYKDDNRDKGVTSVASDNVSFIDIEGTGLERAAKALSDLGIVKGYEDRTFKPGNDITRAEFAAVMIRTLGYEDIVDENVSDTGFADVPPEHWAAGYIKLAKELKLIDGTGNGYEPDKIVTLEQAVKIIVCALGYRYPAESAGGYPSGYLNQAAQLGILKGVDIAAASEGVNRGTTARLIYNSLEVKLMKEEYSGGRISYRTSDETFISRISHITGHRGVVTATSITSLYAVEGTDSYGIEIDGYYYRTSEPVTNELLGRYVEFFYAENSGDEVIKSITPVRNDVTEILSEDIDEVTDTYVEYTDADTSKSKRVKLDKYHVLIYNGREINRFTLSELLPANGKVIFLDNNNDGKSEVVFIEDYFPYIVGSVDVNNNRLILSNDYGCNNQLPTGRKDENGNAIYNTYIELGNEDLFAVTSDGSPIGYTALTAGDVISVMVSADGEYKDIRLVQNYKASGKISSVSGDSLTVKLDGVEYTVMKNENGDAAVKLNSGKIYTVLLDIDGRIFAKTSSASVSKNYGYLLSIYKEDGGDKAGCKMLTLDDKVEEMRLANKVTVKSELENGRMSGTDVAAMLTDENGKSKHQLVVYSVNSNGLISSIELAHSASSNPDFDTSILTMNCGFDEDNIPNSATNSSYFGTVKQYGGTRLGTRFMTNADTVVFSVPVKGSTSSDGTTDYAVDFGAQPSAYSAHKSLVNRGDYIAAIYDSGKNRIAGAVVVYADSNKPEATVDAASMIAVFSEKITSVNDNDEIVEGMEYYVDGVQKTILLSENYMRTIGEAGTTSDCWKALTVGDTIQFAVNEAGEITDIDYHYLQNPPPGVEYYYTYLVRDGGKPNDIMSYIERSRVRDKIGNIVLVDTLPYYLSTTGANAKPTPNESELVTIPYELNTGTVYIVDTKYGKIYPETTAELTDEIIGSDMILQSKYNAIENLVFYLK